MPSRTLKPTLAVLALTAAVAALPVVGGESAGAYPQPSIYPVSWEFDFTYDMPERVVVDVPGVGRRAYWYVTYQVTNNTDQERPFLPSWELMTRDAKVLQAGYGVPAGVFEAIKRDERDPLLLDDLTISESPLRLGEDQARRGVAIWPEPMAEMGQFDIFVGGLSGETATVEVDGQTFKNDAGLPVLLFKTKQLTFRQYGDDRNPGNDLLEQVDERWVMR